ncbi:M10 family metallopeptidase C-terminal domain-containing protein, partial [Sinorhizobium meliloti]
TSAAQLAKLHYDGSKVAIGNIANALQYQGDTRSLIENASGGAGSDTITGNQEANTLWGNDGSDVLNGESGNDALYGGLGRDKVRAGDGNDRILGGPGKDYLSGGTGSDTFVFKKLSESTVAWTGCDTIYDFLPLEGDRIDLSAIDAQLGRSNQAFLFVETAAFSGSKGELRCDQDASGTYIYGDVNGDRSADFAIYLNEVIALQKDYFVL